MATGGFGDDPVPLVQANGQGRSTELGLQQLSFFEAYATKSERMHGCLRYYDVRCVDLCQFFGVKDLYEFVDA